MAKAKPSKNLPFSATDAGLFRAVWETTSEAMVLFDGEGAVLVSNPAFLNLLGLTREETIGRDVSLIFARDFVSMVRARFTEQSDSPGTPLVYENTIKRVDGEERVLDMRVTFLEENGRRVAMLATGRDVTERRRAELALRKSEERYRTLVRNLPNSSAFSFDRNLTILVAGGTGFRKLGLDPNELAGKLIYEALSPELAKQAAAAYESVLEGKTIVAEITLGDQIYEVYYEPLTDEQGAVMGGLVLMQDITLRKRSEQEAERLAAIVESSNDAIIGKTLDGTIYSWNVAAEKLYGYSSDEVIGRNVSILMLADRPDELRTILGQVAAGEKVETYDTVRMGKNGSRLDISLSVSPVLDASGRISGASTIARDITERKAAERAIREYATRQTELLKQVMTAQEGERRRLAMELHDGPLQSLAVSLMALDRARTRTDRGEPDMAKQEIAFARGVIGEITTDVRAVLADLSAEMLAEEGLAVALRHHAELVSEGSDIQVTVDNSVQERLPLETEVLLYRLVQEAVANARKHSQARQIEIRITKETYEDITGLHLAIKDNGIGFDPEEGLKRQKEGSGLGLRSMRQRIVSAGGDMKITSVPGSGTTLEFWCPL